MRLRAHTQQEPTIQQKKWDLVQYLSVHALPSECFDRLIQRVNKIGPRSDLNTFLLIGSGGVFGCVVQYNLGEEAGILIVKLHDEILETAKAARGGEWLSKCSC